MTAYYNEIDPFCALWLQNLMDADCIARGDIDTRSIEDVTPNDVRGYTQCHFFAGIGGWSIALRAAGWPDSRPAWTGSCPCQPFSSAGKGAGFADERHLWPAWQHLIAQCRPATIFGEQVASKDADPWVDLVHADMEGMGYAFGCEPFPAASVGAKHIRDRNYWLADLCCAGLAERISDRRVQREALGASARQTAVGRSDSGRMADAGCQGLPQQRRQRDEPARFAAHGLAGGMAKSHGECAGIKPKALQAWQSESGGDGGIGGMADAHIIASGQGGAVNGWCDSRSNAQIGSGFSGDVMSSCQRPGPLHGFWRAADWLLCTDGKWRPVEPGTFPLAHGLPKSMGRMSPELRRLAEVAGLDAESLKRAKRYRIECLKGYGNAIVPQAAAEFIASYLEAIDALSLA